MILAILVVVISSAIITFSLLKAYEFLERKRLQRFLLKLNDDPVFSGLFQFAQSLGVRWGGSQSLRNTDFFS